MLDNPNITFHISDKYLFFLSPFFLNNCTEKTQTTKRNKKNGLLLLLFLLTTSGSRCPGARCPRTNCLEETNFTQGCQRKVFFQKVFGQNCKVLTKYFYISHKNNKNKLIIINSFVISKESNPF